MNFFWSDRVTIGFQLSATFTYFFGTHYAELVGLIYIALSSVMACRVFRMLLLSGTVRSNPDTAIAESGLRSASVYNVPDREHGGVMPRASRDAHMHN